MNLGNSFHVIARSGANSSLYHSTDRALDLFNEAHSELPTKTEENKLYQLAISNLKALVAISVLGIVSIPLCLTLLASGNWGEATAVSIFGLVIARKIAITIAP